MTKQEQTRENYLQFRKDLRGLSKHMDLRTKFNTVNDHPHGYRRYLYIWGQGARQEGLIRDTVNLFGHGEGRVSFYYPKWGDNTNVPRISICIPNSMFKKED